MTAIAAVLALSSSQLLAQTAPEATQPATTAPVVVAPEIVPDATIPSEPAASSASEPVAAEPTITKTKTTRSTTTRRTTTVTRPAKAAPQVARVPVAAPVAAPAATVAASPAPLVATPVAPAPAVAAPPPVQETPAVPTYLLAIAGAAGVVLLGLIAFGLALRRRRLRRDEEFAATEQYEIASDAPAQIDPLFAETAANAPAPTDPLFAEPAFDAPAPIDPLFAESALAATTGSAGGPSDCSSAAPGSHVEAACDGPTADNPSLSIKKRLKRARFFDQREFLVAAGEAAPIEADAGLPDAVEVPASPTS